MSRRARMLAVLPAVALGALLVAGCGGNDTSAGSPGSTSPAPAASELAHMRQLVDGADSAASVADSDAAGDK